jgi:predicted lysophospholipase L1 biosynthesis ABC-type transport system permease subunit
MAGVPVDHPFYLGIYLLSNRRDTGVDRFFYCNCSFIFNIGRSSSIADVGCASFLSKQGKLFMATRTCNLYRPNNQTTILIVAIGLGTAIICTLFSVRAILLKRIELTARDNRSNTILFDIQPSQTDSVIALAKQFNLPIDGAVPIVNMRLEKVNNITSETFTERQHH